MNIEDLLQSIILIDDPSAGLVLMDHTPPHIPDLRDAAQDIQLDTGLDTVIIRTPDVAIAVSDELTRAQVERGERAMVAQPDPAAGVDAFFATAQGFAVPWLLVAFLCALAILGIVSATAMSTRRASSR